MRDGVHLAADVYMPATASRRKPVILIRTPYGRAAADEQGAPLARLLTTQGFAVVVQDVRGTGDSGGHFKPYTVVEGTDGYDTLDWIVAQDWASNRVGTVGCSYLGEVQDLLAAQRHPAHAAAFIEGAYSYNNGGMRAFSFVRYGAIELAYAVGGDLELLNTLPLTAIRAQMDTADVSYYAKRWPDAVAQWLTKEPADACWQDDGGLYDDNKFDVPAIHMNEWYSVPFSSIKMFDLYGTTASSERARDNQFLVMSPMTHCKTSTATEATFVGARYIGDARFAYFELMRDWFDYWLCGIHNDVLFRPKVEYYLMGKNQWQSAPTWPPPDTASQSLYLGSFHGANSLAGDGTLTLEKPSPDRLGSDRFAYDPLNPVPSCGGPVSGGRVFQPGAYDQSAIEARNDVLIYTTQALARGAEVSGLVRTILHVSSSARDTDFTAKLVDVYPDGRAFNVVEGIVRMRFRNGLESPSAIEPGTVYEVEIDLDSTSNFFDENHRIRLEISSSNFPRFDRNMNTGGPNAEALSGPVAHNVVYHDATHASRLELPITGMPLQWQT
jgi:uncharacterized protein